MTQFAYNFENRLSQITYPDSHVETYLYDYGGHLVRKTTSQGTTTSIYGKVAAPLAEKNEATGSFTDFVQVNGKTYEKLNGSMAVFFHCDSLGTVLALSDSSGTVTDTYEDDPFGKSLTHNGTSVNAYQFVGGYGVRNVSQNRSIMGVRMYDAELGRFVQKDPIGFWGGDINLYRYAKNNPLSSIDASGLASSVDTALWAGVIKIVSGVTALGISVASIGSGNILGIVAVIGFSIGLYDFITGFLQTIDNLRATSNGSCNGVVVDPLAKFLENQGAGELGSMLFLLQGIVDVFRGLGDKENPVLAITTALGDIVGLASDAKALLDGATLAYF